MASLRRPARTLVRAVGLMGVLTMVMPLGRTDDTNTNPTRKPSVADSLRESNGNSQSELPSLPILRRGTGTQARDAATATSAAATSAPPLRRTSRVAAGKSPRDQGGNVQRATPASAIQPVAPLPEPGGFLTHEGARRHGRPDYDEKPIGALTTNILASRGELPANYAAARFDKEGKEFHTVGTSRPWMELVYDWEATSFCHGPLYFEEPNAERLGHTAGPIVQPVVSGAHFFARIPALPYMVVAEPPAFTCTYTLGHYRPGNYAPFRYIRLPLSITGAAFQAGVVTGLVLLIP